MKTTILLFLLLLIARSASARLGESEQDIEMRYGKALLILADDGPVKARSYLSGGFVIVVRFETGISAAEMFAKPGGSEISDNEISILLVANKGGYNWLGYPANLEPGQRSWCSTDKRSRVAYYIEREHQLFITSRQFLDRTAARHKAKEDAKLKGF